MQDNEIKKDDGFRFAILSSLPVTVRFPLIGLFLAGGIVVQLFFGFIPGAALLFVGTLLGVIKGLHSEPKFKPGAVEWAASTEADYDKVVQRIIQLNEWDKDPFDISNGQGAIILVLAIIIVGMLGNAFEKMLPGVQYKFYADAAIVLLPHWITGTRTFLNRNELVMKINALRGLFPMLKANSETTLKFMMGTRETMEGRTVPADVKLVVNSVQPIKGFYGMQIQVSLNNVKNTKYPYIYGVLLAKAGSGLFAGQRLLPPPGNITYEPSQTEEVELIVVRQTTTRQTGYHTPPRAAQMVIAQGWNLATQLLARYKQ